MHSIRFASFLGSLVLKTNERTHSEGNPKNLQGRGRGLERTAIRRPFRSESQRKFEQTERKKRESEKASGSKADRIIYHIFCSRFLPSSDWNTQTQLIRAILFGALRRDNTSRTSSKRCEGQVRSVHSSRCPSRHVVNTIRG